MGAKLQRPTGAVGIAVLALALATSAHGETGRRADFGMRLLTTTPGASSGVAFHVRFKAPDDPNGKPSPIKSVVIAGPSGVRYDNRAAPTCTATDAELQAEGPSACAAGSQVGQGTYTAITGFGPPADPFVGDDLVFNAPGGLIELITIKGTDRTAGFDRLTIAGSTLTAHPPDTPGGPPDGKTATRQIDFTIPARRAGGAALVTTPARCPASHAWSARGTFGFADGATETVVAHMPCRPPRARLTVVPGHARTDERTRFRFGLSRGQRACLGEAALTFAGRRVRIDRAGRASMAVSFRRPGRRWARVHGRGCLGPGAWVRVR
jgi:hypothetical protein